MLSEAKHLLFLFENKQKQILRFAQNDMAPGVFQQPVGPREHGEVSGDFAGLKDLLLVVQQKQILRSLP